MCVCVCVCVADDDSDDECNYDYIMFYIAVACVSNCKNQEYPAVYPACDSCSEYVVCSSTGETSVLPCGDDLNFDTVMGVCTLPELASCG